MSLVIEQVFGQLKKKFKTFSLPAHNATLTNDYESFQIAFALLNLFHKPILSDTSYDDIAHNEISSEHSKPFKNRCSGIQSFSS